MTIKHMTVLINKELIVDNRHLNKHLNLQCLLLLMWIARFSLFSTSAGQFSSAHVKHNHRIAHNIA